MVAMTAQPSGKVKSSQNIFYAHRQYPSSQYKGYVGLQNRSVRKLIDAINYRWQ